MLYMLAILNLTLNSWPRGARLKLQETIYKHLCKGDICSSILTLGTSCTLGTCRVDRVDSLLLFLHLCNSVHGKLFCRDRLSLLTALTFSHSSSCVYSVRKVSSLLLSTDFLWKKPTAYEDGRGGRSCDGL